MASTEALVRALARLNAQSSTRKTDEDLLITLSDWQRIFREHADEVIDAATETCLIASGYFPTTNEFLEEVQAESRARMHRRDATLPANPRNDEPRADSHVAVAAIRAAITLHLPPAGTWDEMAARAQLDTSLLDEPVRDRPRGGEDARGHDHHRGRAHCPVCSRHDHSDPCWRQTCPECGVPGPEPEALWSPCRGCDGSKFVMVGPNIVHPCPECNRRAYGLWLGGHMQPNHRCEECAPTGRRRHADAD